jgi:hypothetical protein
MKQTEINTSIQNLLVEKLNYTNETLKRDEKILRFGFEHLKEDFIKLIIEVENSSDEKEIFNAVGYFLGALTYQLERWGFLK